MRYFALALIASVALFAGGPQPLTLTANGTSYTDSIQNPVEQQTQGGATQPDQNLWVVNNTGLVWDFDDEISKSDTGYLDPGASVTISEPIWVADWQGHITGIEAISYGKEAAFEVSLQVDDGLGTVLSVVSKPPVVVGTGKFKNYRAFVAITEVYTRTSPKLYLIPNSGYGGYGRVMTATWTVTNRDSRRVTLSVTRTTQSQFSFHIANWCQSPEGYPWSYDNQHIFGDPSLGWCNASSVHY